MREHVKAVEDEILSSLSELEFKLEKQWLYVPSLTGNITREGIRKLANDVRIDVVSGPGFGEIVPYTVES